MFQKYTAFIFLFISLFSLFACQGQQQNLEEVRQVVERKVRQVPSVKTRKVIPTKKEKTHTTKSIKPTSLAKISKNKDYLFDALLADGFDYPIGDKNGKGSYQHNGKTHHGWYIATETGEEYSLGIHTGEDWNGKGGGNTDLGQAVYASGKGKVLAAADYGAPWGNIVLVEHLFVENGSIKRVFSQYAHLKEILVEKGMIVNRRQQVGTIGQGNSTYYAHLHFEIRKDELANYPVDYWPSSNGKTVEWVLDNYEDPSDFIDAHRDLLLPSTETDLLIAIKSDYKMHHYKNGQLHRTYEIALSQNPEGHKDQQGDNRLPEGQYRIIQKSTGPFGGNVAEYFGTGWMRLNYPNNFDAQLGLDKKYISKAEFNKIVSANNAKKEPSKHTKLGGGIGIHGWKGEWSLDGNRHLTWGCISMLNSDLSVFYTEVPLQTPIIIWP